MVITDLLERNARLYGSEVALVEVNPSEERDSAVTWREARLIESAIDAPYRREMTWHEFDIKANKFANLLLSRGVEAGTKVAILLMNSLEWLPIYFGILKAGCIAVPLNFRYSGEEIKYCLDLADCEVLVFGPEFIGRMDTVYNDLPQIKQMFFVGKNKPSYAEDCGKLMSFCSSLTPPVEMDEDDYAAIYFSSGTTGFPKAILHKHRSLTASCRTEQKHHGQTRDDVFLCIPPLYHTGAKMHWFGSLLSGSKAVLLRGVKPEWILRTVTEEKCTIVWLLVPWAQDLLDAIESGKIKTDDYLLAQWRLMHIGAQPVPPSLIRRWLKVFPNHQYDTNYGLSESIGPGCVHLGVENVHKVGAIGKAGYLWEVRIIDENGNDVVPGNVGELAVKGPGVMDCYYKNKEATDEEVIVAAKIAQAHEFIVKRDNGYDEFVEEKGSSLSGGQKQRLSIARALVQKTEIILFDEATSALDNETQSKIQQAIDNMKNEYTILIIAHRFSTIINSDRIYYIEEGKVIDSGTHKDLLQKCKQYKNLYESELKEKN